jgi:uracil-DNA glycosylase
MVKPILESSWQAVLSLEMEKPYFSELLHRVHDARNAGKLIYPVDAAVFNAFTLTPFNRVRVLLLGQDPYHGAHQAHGLCFSVPDKQAIPASLKNIFKELEADLGLLPPATGNLTNWAQQGVLMLNAVLTVESGMPGSHSSWGWQIFTDAVIRIVSEQREHVVFLLWGKYAKQKAALIDTSKHLVLTAPHPSPLSYYRGFLGCRHFSATNAYLEAHKNKPVQWG